LLLKDTNLSFWSHNIT